MASPGWVSEVISVGGIVHRKTKAATVGAAVAITTQAFHAAVIIAVAVEATNNVNLICKHSGKGNDQHTIHKDNANTLKLINSNYFRLYYTTRNDYTSTNTTKLV